MKYQGVLTKMRTELGTPIQYYLLFEDDFIHVNQLLGKTIALKFEGYQCLACGQNKKIFRQGYCYDDFYKQPLAGDWIMRPELSKAHLNIEDRNLEVEKSIQLQPHIVYLANSSTIKVGVTRKTQVPTRWIDQGAHEALEILEVPNRYLAGVAEVALKEHVSDKTNWRKMLQNENIEESLIDKRTYLKTFLPDEVLPYFLETNEPLSIDFPVLSYPKKVKSLSLEKSPYFQGVLKGVKGQYLIFEDDTVFNVRNWEGYVATISIL